MRDEYKVVSEFPCCGNTMVTVMIGNGNAAHVMSQEEWHKICGRNHQSEWNTKVDWSQFKQREKYNQGKVS